MGYRHNRDDLLAAAADLAVAEGLNALSFGRLAKTVGIADRTIVYYFPTKADLVGEALGLLATRLQTVLDEAFGPQAMSIEELSARSWPALTTAAADGVIRVYLEAIGLAAARVAPFDSIVPLIVEAWVRWLDARMTTPPDTDRRTAALAALAQLDGLLILRHTVGPEAADAAATVLRPATRYFL